MLHLMRPSHETHPGRPHGFTLIELLSAVALVGVLAAIALPAYKGYRDRVRAKQCAEDVATMAAAIQRFADDNRDYPNSLADVAFNTRTDPWGQPYQYYNIAANGKGGARKDKALNPLNTDFDLYSVGPDGQTKSQVSNKDSLDDVIRANNGGFIGNASDF
jgi:general secretion pathway protein G